MLIEIKDEQIKLTEIAIYGRQDARASGEWLGCVKKR